MSGPAYVAFTDPEGAFRVVVTSSGAVVEVPDGKDALGKERWCSANVVNPNAPLEKVKGWKEIGTACGLNENQHRQLYAASRRDRDPLTIFYDAFDRPWTFVSVIKEWLSRNNKSAYHRELEKSAERARRKRPSPAEIARRCAEEKAESDEDDGRGARVA